MQKVKIALIYLSSLLMLGTVGILSTTFALVTVSPVIISGTISIITDPSGDDTSGSDFIQAINSLQGSEVHTLSGDVTFTQNNIDTLTTAGGLKDGGNFAGTLDGNGNTITLAQGATIGTEGTFALFGTVSGTIKNVTFKGFSVTEDTSVQQSSFEVSEEGEGEEGEGEEGESAGQPSVLVAVVAQTLAQNATIENVVLEGVSVSSTSNNAIVGGIVAVNNGTITNCVIDSTSSITGSGEGSIVGGVAGDMGEVVTGENPYTPTITQCINNATVSGNGIVGGIVGLARADVMHSSNYGSISNTGNRTVYLWEYNTPNAVGGIAGYIKGRTATDFAYGGYVGYCSNFGTISSASGNTAGGVFGATHGRYAQYSYSTILATGATYNGVIGGGAWDWGNNFPSINDCYAVGEYAGDFVYGVSSTLGDLFGVATQTTYYNETTSPQFISAKAFAKEGFYANTSSIFKQHFIEDTQNVNNGYPIHLWQKQVDVTVIVSGIKDLTQVEFSVTSYEIPIDANEFTYNVFFKESKNSVPEDVTGLTQSINGGSVTLSGFSKSGLYYLNVTALNGQVGDYRIANAEFVVNGDGSSADWAKLIDSETAFNQFRVETQNAGSLSYWKMIRNINVTTDTGNNTFSINFNGCDYLITYDSLTSTKLWSPLFGHLTAGSNVRNLNIYADIYRGDKGSAIVALSNMGTIEKVHTSGILRSEGGGDISNKTGAITRHNGGTIDGCTNSAEIIGRYAVGGIVGYNTETGSIINCSNSGKLTSTYGTVGGIVGYTINAIDNSNTNEGLIGDTVAPIMGVQSTKPTWADTLE